MGHILGVTIKIWKTCALWSLRLRRASTKMKAFFFFRFSTGTHRSWKIFKVLCDHGIRVPCASVLQKTFSYSPHVNSEPSVAFLSWHEIEIPAPRMGALEGGEGLVVFPRTTIILPHILKCNWVVEDERHRSGATVGIIWWLMAKNTKTCWRMLELTHFHFEL